MFTRGIIVLDSGILCLQEKLLFWSGKYYVCKMIYCFGVGNTMFAGWFIVLERNLLCFQVELLFLDAMYYISKGNYCFRMRYIMLAR